MARRPSLQIEESPGLGRRGLRGLGELASSIRARVGFKRVVYEKGASSSAPVGAADIDFALARWDKIKGSLGVNWQFSFFYVGKPDKKRQPFTYDRAKGELHAYPLVPDPDFVEGLVTDLTKVFDYSPLGWAWKLSKYARGLICEALANGNINGAIQMAAASQGVPPGSIDRDKFVAMGLCKGSGGGGGGGGGGGETYAAEPSLFDNPMVLAGAGIGAVGLLYLFLRRK